MNKYFKNAWALEDKWRVAAIFGLGVIVFVMGIINTSVPHSHSDAEHTTNHALVSVCSYT